MGKKAKPEAPKKPVTPFFSARIPLPPIDPRWDLTRPIPSAGPGDNHGGACPAGHWDHPSTR